MRYNQPAIKPSDDFDEYSAFNTAIRTILYDYLFTIDIVEVVAVKENNAFIDVKPVLQNRTTGGATLPITQVIHNVPMLTLFGAGCEISIPATVGDKGILLSCKDDIAEYKLSQQVSIIPTLRRFAQSNGVFIPLDFKTKQEGVTIRNNETLIHLLSDKIEIKTKTVDVQADTINVAGKDKKETYTGTMDMTAPTLTINNSASTVINSPNVTIGGAVTVAGGAIALGSGGGSPVSRVGDTISVTIDKGSSAGTYTGTITSGSSSTTAS